MDYVLYGALIVGLIAGGIIVARSPTFWIGFGKAALLAVLPSIIKVVSPRDITKEEKDRIARGEEPGIAGQNTRNNDGMHHK